MAPTRLGFLGGGRVARILLTGLDRAGAPGEAVVCDADPDVRARLETDLDKVTTTDDASAAAGQDVVFLAVHPPAVGDVLARAAPALGANALLVSLAPKLTMAKLSEMLGGFDRIARLIPNAPSVVCKGYNPVAFSDALGGDDRARLLELLGALGDAPEVSEEHLEAYAVISAMGPTYLWPQLYELQSLAESFGLSREAAAEAVGRMAAGSAATMTESGLSAEAVQDLIPVQPMADDVAALNEAYRTKLTGLMDKLRT